MRGAAGERLPIVEKIVFYSLCGFALCTNLSVAGANICLTVCILGAGYRFFLKRNDLKDIFSNNQLLFSVVGVFLVSQLLSTVASDAPVSSLRVFGDHYVYRMAIFFIVLAFVRSKEQILWLIKFALISALINNIAAIGQGIVHFGDAPGRFSGFMFYMAQGTSLAVWLSLLTVFTIREARYRKWGWGLLGIFCIAMWLNGTRGAWIAAAVTMSVAAFMCVRSKKKFFISWMAAVVLLSGLIAVVPGLYQRTMSITQMDVQSNAERIRLWTSSNNMFFDHPFLGVGVGRFADEYHAKYILPEAKERHLEHAHNNVMHLAAESGVVGVFGFLVLWGYFSYFGVRGWYREKNLAYLAFFVIVTGIMLHGLTEYTLGRGVTMKFFWFSLGVCLQWIRCGQKDHVA